jgi:hypothetical protein
MKINQRGHTMNKILMGILLLTLAVILPQPLRAEVNISIGFGLPEPVYFERPPEVIVLPDTRNVYVVPESEFDLFFWNGWWWRPWQGRWYRSRSYNRGWAYYNNIPSFYYDVDPEWRDYYRARTWSGHRWNYERIPHQRLQSNWKQWHDKQYWQRNRTWGVEGYRPRPQRQVEEIRAQRQEHYRQQPEVQRHQQEMQQYQRQPEAQRQQRQQIQEQQQQPEVQRQQQRQIQEQQRQPEVQRQQQRQQIEEQQRQRDGQMQQIQERQHDAQRQQQRQVQEQQQQLEAQQQQLRQIEEKQRQPQDIKRSRQREPQQEDTHNRNRQRQEKSNRQKSQDEQDEKQKD